MKILYLFSSAETSIAIVTLNQINALRRFYPELEIKIACVNYYRERSVLEGQIDFCKKINKNQILNYFQSINFVRKVKKEFKPDITISNLGAVNAFNALFNVNDIKIGIFHSPMIQFNKKNYISRVLNSISIKNNYPKLDVVIGISEEVVNDLKIHLVSNNDIALFHNIHDVRNIIKKGHSLITDVNSAKEKFEILCLGAIDRNKRQDVLLKYLNKYPSINIKIYIVGKITDEIYYKEIIDFIEKNDLKDYVEFLPFNENPYPLIKRVDLLVSLSESEGLPGVVIESLILNTPVICTNSSRGVWEILDKSQEYKSEISNKVIAEKGIIIPNPKSIDEENLIKIFKESLDYIELNYKKFILAKFSFLNDISDVSIHKFYKFLQKKINENNS